MKAIIVPIFAIAGIIFLEAYALHQGINGALMGIVVAAVAGLGGYEVKALRDKYKKPK